jgi:SAM-dependent methyltransferase
MPNTNYVQYGAAFCGPEEWLNFDVSPTLRLQRIPLIGPMITRSRKTFPDTVKYGDILSGLPIAKESCDAIYCSHTLEHLALDDFRLALKNTYSYLRPGGRFRFCLPDLEAFIRAYASSDKPEAAMAFMENTYLGYKKWPRGLSGLVQLWIGNAVHRWMWDWKSIHKELVDAGFVNIRRAEYGDSGDPMFEHVEERNRWDGHLGVDCFRPTAAAANSASGAA